MYMYIVLMGYWRAERDRRMRDETWMSLRAAGLRALSSSAKRGISCDSSIFVAYVT